jgi:hypothetical protein
MGVVYVPTTNPSDWQALLKDPVRHWQAGFSAMELATVWLAADGLPGKVAGATSSCRCPRSLRLRN